MDRVNYSETEQEYHAALSFLLAFFWICGIFCGLLLFAATEHNTILWMRRIGETSIGWSSLLFVSLIPFLLSFAAEFLHIFYTIYPLAFFKAMVVAFACSSLFGTFGNAAWMMGFFLLFHDIFSLPILYFNWLRCIRNNKGSCGLGYTLFRVSAVILVYSVDIYVMLPFATSILNAVNCW